MEGFRKVAIAGLLAAASAGVFAQEFPQDRSALVRRSPEVIQKRSNSGVGLVRRLHHPSRRREYGRTLGSADLDHEDY